jgi:hypothetical protein
MLKMINAKDNHNNGQEVDGDPGNDVLSHN